MSKLIDIKNWAAFACAMRVVRERFPEHAEEIDRAIYDVGQKLESCGDPNCTCKMNFENFRAIANQNAHEEEIRSNDKAMSKIWESLEKEI